LLSFPRGTEMFQFPRWASQAYGFSLRSFRDLGLNARLTAPPRLSQSSTPFIASWRPDIPHTPLVAWPHWPRPQTFTRVKPDRDAACQDHPRACIVSGIVTFLLSLPKGSTENRKNCHALDDVVAHAAENAVVLVIATFTACPNCQRTTAVSKRRLFFRGRVRRFPSAKDSCFLAVNPMLSRGCCPYRPIR
jgi:hypothetical protein